MCVLCSQLWVDDHWTDVSNAPGDQGDVVVLESHAARRGVRLRERAARARLCNLILASRGLSLQDWEGSSYILRDAKGQTAVVSNLAQVWVEVERLLGAPIDPLDADLIRNLQKRGASIDAS